VFSQSLPLISSLGQVYLSFQYKKKLTHVELITAIIFLVPVEDSKLIISAFKLDSGCNIRKNKKIYSTCAHFKR
jgi:hypothetical protein